VLVHSGFEDRCRPYDLHVDAYLNWVDFQSVSTMSINDAFTSSKVGDVEYVIVNEIVGVSQARSIYAWLTACSSLPKTHQSTVFFLVIRKRTFEPSRAT
jgi:hypothetical protein